MLFTKRIDDVDNNRFGLIFANELDEQFEVAFFCKYGENFRIVECNGNFDLIKADKYLITELFHSYRHVYPSKKIYLNVQGKGEAKLELLSIKGKIKQSWSLLNLTFNKEINSKSISNFKLYNETLIYDLNLPHIKQLSQKRISVNFDFTHIPQGGYHLGMKYKGDEYKFSNILLNITEKYPNYIWNLKNTIYSLFKQK